MWAIVVKEFNKPRRDRRMPAMLIAILLLLLVVFGHAARLDVSAVPIAVVGPSADVVSARLPVLLDVRRTDQRADPRRRRDRAPGVAGVPRQGRSVLPRRGGGHARRWRR